MWRSRNLVRAKMVLGLALVLWGQIALPGILGWHGTQLATTIALACTAVGWLGWAVTGPGGDSTAVMVWMCGTGLAGSVLLFLHPVSAVCWFALFACLVAGAALPTRVSAPLAGACVALLLIGYLLHRGHTLPTYASVLFVAYAVGLGRRSHARAAMLDERARIAGELHDVLSHSLTALAVQVQAASAALLVAGDRDRALTHLSSAERLIRSGQEETVAAVRTLRDGAVGVHELAQRLIDASGLPARLTVEGTPRELSAATGMAVYRLLQEALTNAGKHAPGSDTQIVLRYDRDRLTITVDNETVAGVEAVTGSHGLRTMRDRITQVGGAVASGAVGDRWEVRAWVPA
jgi:two-component sensor histidine kinase